MGMGNRAKQSIILSIRYRYRAQAFNHLDPLFWKNTPMREETTLARVQTHRIGEYSPVNHERMVKGSQVRDRTSVEDPETNVLHARNGGA
jgi:hypothetical protein